LRDLLVLVDEFLPKAVLIENVVGFIRMEGGALSLIRSTLNAINRREGTSYHLTADSLNAVDYGVPQRRERAILVAFRDGSCFDWPTSTHTVTPIRSWDAIGDLEEAEKPVATGKWAQLLPSIPEGWNYLWHTDRGGGRPLFGYRSRYWSFLLKLAKSEPSWTLPAQPGPATGPFHWDNRPLSVKEMLRLQSFPATWKVAGNYREQVLQVGNATPPLLAEIVAREIAKQAFARRYSSAPKLEIRGASSVPAAKRRTSVPSSYLHLEGVHPAHRGTGCGPKPTSLQVLAA